jgi:hypothetical protein
MTKALFPMFHNPMGDSKQIAKTEDNMILPILAKRSRYSEFRKNDHA